MCPKNVNVYGHVNKESHLLSTAADRVTGHARGCARERACPKNVNVYGHVNKVSQVPSIANSVDNLRV